MDLELQIQEPVKGSRIEKTTMYLWNVPQPIVDRILRMICMFPYFHFVSKEIVNTETENQIISVEIELIGFFIILASKSTFLCSSFYVDLRPIFE